MNRENPSDWNGINPNCKLCEKEIEKNDEYCEDHQRCFWCGDNDNCDCDTKHPDDIAINEIDKTLETIEEEEIEYSCCGDDMTGKDIRICPTCKEHQ
tara:strand:- start:1933 stop:2223 length:291 start_codon:yes stop_codon:yes gene_type:complete